MVTANTLYQAHGYTYHYDQQDRLLSVMGPEGFLLESSSYDPAGNLSIRTDAEGNRVKFDYDLAGRNTRITSAGETTQLLKINYKDRYLARIVLSGYLKVMIRLRNLII